MPDAITNKAIALQEAGTTQKFFYSAIAGLLIAMTGMALLEPLRNLPVQHLLDAVGVGIGAGMTISGVRSGAKSAAIISEFQKSNP